MNTSAIIQRYPIFIQENNTDFRKQVYEQYEEQTPALRKFVRKPELEFKYFTLVDMHLMVDGLYSCPSV